MGQTCALPSLDTATIYFPSGLNAADMILPPFGKRRVTSASLSPSVSQTRAAPSSDAITTRVPSGLNAADFTQPDHTQSELACSPRSLLPLRASQIRIVPPNPVAVRTF